MDYEEFLACSYTPMKAIEVLSDIIYTKCNEDWNLCTNIQRKDRDELLALNFAIKTCAKYLLKKRNEEVSIEKS